LVVLREFYFRSYCANPLTLKQLASAVVVLN
jgi:hypothetical protein